MSAKIPGIEDFQALLGRKGLKYTYERQHICDFVLKHQDHFDADGLYELLKEKGMRISRDTVYRTIPLLLESGVIQKSVGKGKREFFERMEGKGHHDHLLCLNCEKVLEVHCQEIEDLQDKLAEKHGFKLAYHDHRMYGYCQDCR